MYFLINKMSSSSIENRICLLQEKRRKNWHEFVLRYDHIICNKISKDILIELYDEIKRYFTDCFSEQTSKLLNKFREYLKECIESYNISNLTKFSDFYTKHNILMHIQCETIKEL